MYPLKVREGEKPIMEEAISFAEMYRRKMSKDLELARIKKQKEKMVDVPKAQFEPKPIEKILA